MAKAAKRRELLGGLTLLLVSTALMLLAIEYAFRYVLGDSIVLFPRNHAAAQYGPYVLRSMVPNTVFWHQSIDGRWRFRTNNKGFRDDRNYAYDKSPGTFRVLVLGDSHTAGFEVHQSEVFTHVLETSLRHRGVKVEVLNTGISGFGTAEHLVFLEQEGLRYRPDVVILAFFGNDYSDSARSGLYKLERDMLTVSSRHYAPAVDIIRVTNAVPGLKWLGENSYAYSYLFNAAWNFFKARSIRQADTSLAQTNAPSADREYAVVVREISAAEEDLVVALLKRIAGVARENKVLTILVDIPGVAASDGISPSLRPRTRQVGIDDFDYMLESDQYLQDRPAGQLVHVPNGHRHISAYTHRHLGEALANLLAAKGVVTTTAGAAPR
jgi:hypothetical protein